MRKGILGSEKLIYWTDTCKVMAFDLSAALDTRSHRPHWPVKARPRLF